jgi:hypothetical protein
MKIQFLKVYIGPPYELKGAKPPEKVDVPDGVDPQSIISMLYGSNWRAEQVQILGAL